MCVVTCGVCITGHRVVCMDEKGEWRPWVGGHSTPSLAQIMVYKSKDCTSIHYYKVYTDLDIGVTGIGGVMAQVLPGMLLSGRRAHNSETPGPFCARKGAL